MLHFRREDWLFSHVYLKRVVLKSLQEKALSN